ncbi:BglG family transcription antiterminator [Fodinisporobacter ferrooxydans]|uniref:BglG family transcription antiterminator n=1 Tax=Fodinisporobacter ferrooxydans TaxID=2901836 RepID=A0ABY4CPP5_9BACL|nr:BglG family transcription antiterminator [Alicyclobacillaceae bacterium MYW30-H2]
MNISSRQRMILDILLREREGLTIKDLAEEIEVSSRTVHRELNEIETLLEKFGLIVIKKSGVGVQVLGTPEQMQELQSELLDITTTEYTVSERKALILCTLLEAVEPVKLISLAYDLKVTSATISHDLDDLEEWLRQFGLSVIRKRGYGIEIEGSEAAKRKAMSSFISDNLDETELLGAIKDTIQNKTFKNINTSSERLLGLIEKEKLIKVETALRDVEKELPYPLADSAYIGLVIHLSLVIERIVKGEKIDFDVNYLKELSNTHEYHIAQKIIERLKHFFKLTFPVGEVGYITMHLLGAKLRNSTGELFPAENMMLSRNVQQLIKVCEEKLGINFTDERSLFQGLLTHMEPAIHRIKQNMKIRNPVLQQIKKDYAFLFEIIEEAVTVVFPHLHVPDEEIGYLVMHFGASLEKEYGKIKRIRAYIVCSSGIGTSKMLASRIEKEIPEIEVLKNISLFEIGNIDKSQYDVIISTIALPGQQEEYILVSPLLSEEEIKKIKDFIRRIRIRNTIRNQKSVSVNTESPIAKLKSLQIQLGQIVHLIEGFHVYELNNESKNIRETLNQACEILSDRNVIKNKDTVVNQLLAREQLGGLGIPHTTFALFHGRSEHVTKSSFNIFSLKHSIHVQSMENTEISIKNILLLLGPKEMQKENLETLSEISSLLIADETAVIVERGNEASIRTYFAKKLYEFYLKTMKTE